jgi:ABC-type antimicrobial peptide transport system permease subunit
MPLTQLKENMEYTTFELRTGMRPSLLASAAEEAIGTVNKSIPLEFQTLSQQLDDSIARERLLATLSMFFGGLALLLAMIGLYGALSYLVTQRQVEFGIRMALGAAPNSILRLVLKDLIFVLGLGLVAGIALSLATVGILQKLLFGLQPRDTLTLATAAGVLAVVAIVAAMFPARRAMRVDPMVALRYE